MTDKDLLIDRVLEQITEDVHMNDFTAIAELLEHMPEEFLKGYLPEDA
jgi:hypothetical protein